MPENRRGLRGVKGGAGVKREALGDRIGVTGCRGARVAFWDVEEGAGDRRGCRGTEVCAGGRRRMPGCGRDAGGGYAWSSGTDSAEPGRAELSGNSP